MEKISYNKRTTKRPTKIQINTLIDYMATHPSFATLQGWSVKGPLGPRRQLEKLVETLNCLGPKRTGAQWLTTWRDLKRRARTESVEVKQAANQMGKGVKISDFSVQSQKILSTFDIGEEDIPLGEGVSEPNIHIEETNIHIEDSKSEDIYEIVITCCMDLVRVHGRPVEMFDDEAFKNIIKLVPLSETQINSLDSKTMKLVLGYQSNTEEKDGNDGTQEMATAEIHQDQSNAESIINNKLKQEDTASPTNEEQDEGKKCTCPTNDSKSNAHTNNCNIQLQGPCWKYFNVTLDRAECNLCKKAMKWSNISVLDQHLYSKHPEIQFQEKNNEEDPISIKCYLSPTQSTIDMDEEYEFENTNKNHLYTPSESNSQHDAIELSDNKFKALDSFGVYIVSLLRIIPEKRSAKLQGLIVQKLLQEQIEAC